MATNLLKLEGERVQLAGKDDEIISDANLAKLLDRSPAAYARRTGWVSSHKGEEGEVGSDESAGERMAFEVSCRWRWRYFIQSFCWSSNNPF